MGLIEVIAKEMKSGPIENLEYRLCKSVANLIIDEMNRSVKNIASNASISLEVQVEIGKVLVEMQRKILFDDELIRSEDC